MFAWVSDMNARTLWKHNASGHYVGKGIKTNKKLMDDAKTILSSLVQIVKNYIKFKQAT